VLASQGDREALISSRDDWTVAEAKALVQARAHPSITLYTNTGEAIQYPEPKGPATFNETTGEGISWAAWNPVTGCLHGCDYCYARAIANRFREQFPAGPDGFTPLFHTERLEAPKNTTIPAAHRADEAYKRVFVCSMADLYGQWVPEEWITQVHEAMLASPEWQYLLLTKFPSRYTKLAIPPGAWVGTSVDEQKRVRIAEKAFREIEGENIRKWLSLEPLTGPLEFSDLSMFDWVVIGGQTETRQPWGVEEQKAPEWDWVVDLYNKAREAGCRVHIKPNLGNGKPGMIFPNEYPDDNPF
jgi:protein gp37